jgi:hypothetical protein
MKKPPGVFSLMATAVTGFGTHLVHLSVNARVRLLALLSRKTRPSKR